jgi:uncharacterized protein
MTDFSDDGVALEQNRIGLVDGSVPANTRRYQIVLDETQHVELDELVVTSQELPDGQSLHHYGIVVEGMGEIEGAEFASDTQRIHRDQTMPGITSRQVEVQVLRTVPEKWLPPAPGSSVQRATGEHRANALFLDQMTDKLPVGLDQQGQPVFGDWAFMNGEKGGHFSISGVSGVATKTSYALFLLYMLFETPDGRALLGASAPNTRALVFNVKGEDLLHLDKPNNRFVADSTSATEWAQLGVPAPGPFSSVRFYAPRSQSSGEHNAATDITSRTDDKIVTYGWSPWDFIQDGLLRYCLTEAEDSSNQISFIEQRVRVQLMRWAYPLEGEDGAVVLDTPPAGTTHNPDRIRGEGRKPRQVGEGFAVRNFGDLVDFLEQRLGQAGHPDPEWDAGTQQGTVLAFLRRLFAQRPRLGHLISIHTEKVELQQFVTVVDIHSLHDSAQRFVVGALLSRIFEEKQGSGREPLRFIVLDELNKYAPKDGRSPIKEVLVDIAARGRSLGVLLIGAQQSAADVERSVVINSAIKVVGRLDAGEAAEYRFLTPEMRERAARFLPGTMVFDQPMIPAPLPFRFPFPPYATCVAESKLAPGTRDKAKGKQLFEQLKA